MKGDTNLLYVCAWSLLF